MPMPMANGLTNQEEAEIGTLRENAYSDGDTVPDGEDGWPLDADLHPPRIANPSYAVINLSSLGFTEPKAFSSKGYILDKQDYASARVWQNGQFTPIPKPEAYDPNAVSDWTNSISDSGKAANVYTYTTVYNQSSVSAWSPAGGSQTLNYFAPGFPLSAKLSNYPAGHTVTPSGAVLGRASGSFWQYNFFPTPIISRGYETGLRWAPGATTAEPVGNLISWNEDVEANKRTYTPGTYVSPSAENASGSVVGWGQVYTSTGPQSSSNAVLWKDGAAKFLSNVPYGNGSFAYSINNATEPMIVGIKNLSINWYEAPYYWLQQAQGTIERRLIYYDPVQQKRISPVGQPYQVNDRFEVSGTFGLVQNGVLVDWKKKLPGYSHLWITQIDNRGCVLGVDSLTTGSQAQHLFLLPVEMTWEANSDWNNVSNNKADSAFRWSDAVGPTDGLWLPGRGKRIFPDAASPSQLQSRNRVKLKIHTAPNINAENKVYLKSFDVDDPTPEAFDVGPVKIDSSAAGNDNRDTSDLKQGKFVSSGSNSVAVSLDANGDAEVLMDVSQFAGDNYRVALAFKQSDLSALQVDTSGASGFIEGDSEKQPSGFNGGMVSPMLTVWRKLHVEVDSMAAVPNPKPAPDRIAFTGQSWNGNTLTVSTTIPMTGTFYKDGTIKAGAVTADVVSTTSNTITVGGSLTDSQKASFVNQTFILNDDDDKSLADISINTPLPRLEFLNALAVSKFTTAYILPVDATAEGFNNVRQIPFKLNADPYDSVFSNGRELTDQETFWAYQLIYAYQPETESDHDPDTDPETRSGGTPVSAFQVGYGYSVVYEESIRENILSNSLGWLPSQAFLYWNELNLISIHELCHVPGRLSGESDHGEGGIMDGSYIPPLAAPAACFTVKTITRLRSSKQWTN